MSKYLVTLNSSMAAAAAVALVIFAVPVSGLFGWYSSHSFININLQPNPEDPYFYKHTRNLRLLLHKNNPPELLPRSFPNISVQDELFRVCINHPHTLIVLGLFPDEDLSLQDVVSQIDALSEINRKVQRERYVNNFEACPYGHILLSRPTPKMISK